MKYMFLLFALLFSNVYSSDLNKYEDINSILVSKNKEAYQELTKKLYKEYKNLKVEEFSIKVGIDKGNLKKEPYYLSIITDINSLKATNAKYFMRDYMMIIKLDASVEDTLYFDFSYENPERIAFRFNVISDFEYNYILPFEGILYGLAYGIIFSAFLYYLIIYFSTRKIYFLYYSSMQLCVLLALIGFVFFSFKSYPSILGQEVVDIFETLGLLFSLLFAKQILNTKKVMPFINYLLNIFVFLNILDIFLILIFKYSLLYEIMPFYIAFLVPAIAGVTAIIKGNKIAIFYTFGWSFLASIIYLYEHDIIPLSGIYTIHIAAPFESLVFSFALAIMLKELVNKQNEQEKLLIHKSKLASMGEMINNIAHQWRQPLMHLGYINMNLEMASSNNEFEKEYFVKKIKESNSQIKFMSKTIDDFGDFYKIEKEKQDFSILNACELAINIISPTLKKKNIILNLSVEKDSRIKAYENEYAQVMLNFLTNCVDVFVSRKTKNPIINVTIDNINNQTITKVCDNAGGIEEADLNRIFQAQFTTKKRGSGIGLYMSQVIVQSHFQGNISATNNKKGACFTIEV